MMKLKTGLSPTNGQQKNGLFTRVCFLDCVHDIILYVCFRHRWTLPRTHTPQSGPQSQPPHSKPQRPKRSCHERSNEQHHSFSSGGCVTSASKSGSAEWFTLQSHRAAHRVREMTYRFVIMHSQLRATAYWRGVPTRGSASMTRQTCRWSKRARRAAWSMTATG